MSTVINTKVNESVQVSSNMLVRLNRQAASLTLHSGHILARQTGDFQSPFKGRGMEFDESRLYQAGDDIRNINWRVTARTGKPHTKLFREERERPVFLWLDLRPPMFFATRGCFKSVLAAQLASLLAWSANHHGDRTGGVIFSDTSHHELKPQRGKSAVLRLINQIVNHSAWQSEKNMQAEASSGLKALVRLRRVVRPGSMIFLISDFRNLDEIAMQQISLLSRHNDIAMIFVYDPLEANLPDTGHYRVSDGQDDILLDTYDRERTTRYHRRFVAQEHNLQDLARKNRMTLLSCSTQDDPYSVLKQGLGD